MCTSGCGARPAAAVLIRAQVSHSQHIRVRLQPVQNKLHGGLRAQSQGMCTVACLPNHIEEIHSYKKTLGIFVKSFCFNLRRKLISNTELFACSSMTIYIIKIFRIFTISILKWLSGENVAFIFTTITVIYISADIFF